MCICYCEKATSTFYTNSATPSHSICLIKAFYFSLPLTTHHGKVSTDKHVCVLDAHTDTHTHTHTPLCFVRAALSSLQALNTASDSDTFAYTAISSLEKRPQIQIVGNTYEENFLK